MLGAGEGFFFVSALAAASDLAPDERRGEAISFLSLSLYLGIAIGPPVAEVLFVAGSYALVWAAVDFGRDARDGESILTFIARVADVAHREVARHDESGHFAELASLALRRALTGTVGEHGGSLFGSSVDDLQSALRTHSTDRSFGRVSRRFFGEFMARMLASFEPWLATTS